ncbi:hypothetical protein [Amycolatopsis nigrescens]|uniref:hypothetical protein n=1 Tax=Amycolatopsis nigrescens TaxID=381445 RepID=UPI00037C75D3|nr:hypothetical protein [Amycolatopsis nigrescens]
MAEAISDRQVVAVLRPFVRATGPMLDALRESDPLGLRTRRRDTGDAAELAEVEPGLRDKLLDGLASVKVPGTAAWAEMDTEQRTQWWVHRVGRFTALLTSIPGLGGVLADRLPLQDTLGTASQGLLLCAIAGEHGVTGLGERVRLIAWVLFERDIDPVLAAGKHAEHDASAEDAETAELTEEMDESSKKHGRITLKASARTLWRLGRSLLGITEELEKRPRGRFYHRAVGMLPVVGMAGDYFGERSGLKRVAKRADRWLAEHRPVA